MRIFVNEQQQICCVVDRMSDDGDEAALFDHFLSHVDNYTNATNANLFRLRRWCHFQSDLYY